MALEGAERRGDVPSIANADPNQKTCVPESPSSLQSSSAIARTSPRRCARTTREGCSPSSKRSPKILRPKCGGMEWRRCASLSFISPRTLPLSKRSGGREARMTMRLPSSGSSRESLAAPIKANARRGDPSIQSCAVKTIENIMVTAAMGDAASAPAAAAFLASHDTLVQLRAIATSKSLGKRLRCSACNALCSLVRVDIKLLPRIAEGEGWGFLVSGLADDSHPTPMRRAHLNVVNYVFHSGDRAVRESILVQSPAADRPMGSKSSLLRLKLSTRESCDSVLRAKAQLCVALLLRARYPPLMRSGEAFSAKRLCYVDRAVQGSLKRADARASPNTQMPA